MKVQTQVKAGGRELNHNQTIVRTPFGWSNHNQTLVRRVSLALALLCGSTQAMAAELAIQANGVIEEIPNCSGHRSGNMPAERTRLCVDN